MTTTRARRGAPRYGKAAAATTEKVHPLIKVLAAGLIAAAAPFVPGPWVLLVGAWIIGSALLDGARSEGSNDTAELITRVFTRCGAGFLVLAVGLYVLVYYGVHRAGAPYYIMCLGVALAAGLSPAIHRRSSPDDMVRLVCAAALLVSTFLLRMSGYVPVAPPYFPEFFRTGAVARTLVAMLAVGILLAIWMGGKSAPRMQSILAVLIVLLGLAALVALRLPAAGYALLSSHPDAWYHILKTRIYTSDPTIIDTVSNPVLYVDSIIYPRAVMHMVAAALADSTRTLVADCARFYMPVLQTLLAFAGVFLFCVRAPGPAGVAGATAATCAVLLSCASHVSNGGWDFTSGSTLFVSQYFATACLLLYAGVLRFAMLRCESTVDGAGRTSWRQCWAPVTIAAAGGAALLYSHVLTTAPLLAGMSVAWIYALLRRSRILPQFSAMLAGAGVLFVPYVVGYLIARSRSKLAYDLTDQLANSKMLAGAAWSMIWSSYGPLPLLAVAGGGWLYFRRGAGGAVRHLSGMGVLVACALYLMLILGIPVSLIPNRMVPLLGACWMLLLADLLTWSWERLQSLGSARTLAQSFAAAALLIPAVVSLPYKGAPAVSTQNAWEAVLKQAEVNSCDTTAGAFASIAQAIRPNTGKGMLVLPYSGPGHWAAAYTHDPAYIYSVPQVPSRAGLDGILRKAVEALRPPSESQVLMWVSSDNYFISDKAAFEQALSAIPTSPALHHTSPGNVFIAAKARDIVAGTW
jgi:hypothetical protein